MKIKIGIIGLGYVGLPLLYVFSKKYHVLGYDININRIDELNCNVDRTLEISEAQLIEMKNNNAILTSDPKDLKSCNFFIITVPTPVDKNKTPDLSLIIKASELVSSYLKKGDYVIYESTVYPGATEEVCIPILEKNSGLSLNDGFYCGYSPERVNPGDKEHTIDKIKKVTSGSNEFSRKEIDKIYSSVITAGTYSAQSIKVAEAAKVIENTQRDINIAFVNELAMLFNKIGIDTREVLEAASTKWNFLKFYPGLVGGHCIGVDPYYLSYKALSLGFNPEIILAGRRTNEFLASYIAGRIVKLILSNKKRTENIKTLVLGVTFKENCPDIRNSKVFDLIDELEAFGLNIDISDCLADNLEVEKYYGRKLESKPDVKNYDVIIFGVFHDQYKTIKTSNGQIVYDVQAKAEFSNERL